MYLIVIPPWHTTKRFDQSFVPVLIRLQTKAFTYSSIFVYVHLHLLIDRDCYTETIDGLSICSLINSSILSVPILCLIVIAVAAMTPEFPSRD